MEEGTITISKQNEIYPEICRAFKLPYDSSAHSQGYLIRDRVKERWPNVDESVLRLYEIAYGGLIDENVEWGMREALKRNEPYLVELAMEISGENVPLHLRMYKELLNICNNKEEEVKELLEKALSDEYIDASNWKKFLEKVKI